MYNKLQGKKNAESTYWLSMVAKEQHHKISTLDMNKMLKQKLIYKENSIFLFMYPLMVPIKRVLLLITNRKY